MYALVTNPEVLVPATSYQYRVISVLADPRVDRLASGSGFEKWEPDTDTYKMTSTITVKAPQVPSSVAKYKLIATQTDQGIDNRLFWVRSGNAPNLTESQWKALWDALLKDPATQNAISFQYFKRQGLIYPRPWYLKYGYAGVGGAVLGALLLGYGVSRLFKK